MTKTKTKKPKIKCLNNFVFIDPEKVDNKLDSGIYIPESSDLTIPNKGTVVSNGDKGGKTELSEGDQVIYDKNANMNVQIVEGYNLVLVREEQVFAKIIE